MDEYVASANRHSSSESWALFWRGALGGLVLCGLILGAYALFNLSPMAKQAKADKPVYVEPIARSELIETLLSQRNALRGDVVQIQDQPPPSVLEEKKVEVPVVLLNEPKRAPVDAVLKDIVERVEVIAAKPRATPAQPVNAIQNDLDQLFPE